MDNFYLAFGQSLKQRRQAAHLTQEDLASKVGLGRTSVTNIEQGRQHVPLHMLYELADALGADPASLLPRMQSKNAVLSPKLESKVEQFEKEEEKQWFRQLVASTEPNPR